MRRWIDGAGVIRFHAGMRLRTIALSFICGAVLSAAAQAGTLEDIRARGVINCAVAADAPGISQSVDGKRAGIAIDVCSMLAAAILGRADATAYVEVTEADAIVALQAEDADVLLLPRPWRFAEEVDDGILMVSPLLGRSRDGAAFGPMLRQGDDAWLVAVRWIMEAFRAGAAAVPGDAQQTAVAGFGFAPG